MSNRIEKDWHEELKNANDELKKYGYVISVREEEGCFGVDYNDGKKTHNFASGYYEDELAECVNDAYYHILDNIQEKINSYKRQQLIVKAWVYFGYNYSDPKELIHYICEKTGQLHLEQHFISKFNHIYEVYGCHAVMNRFYVEINKECQAALVDYAVKEYFPNAFTLSDEDKRLLGI